MCTHARSINTVHRSCLMLFVANVCRLRYLRGLGGATVDHKKGIAWLEQAANQDYAESQFQLGTLYQKGTPLFFSSLFSQCIVLGENGTLCFAIGLGDTPKNAGLAVKWYAKAAEQQNEMAMTNLGHCYLNGEWCVGCGFSASHCFYFTLLCFLVWFWGLYGACRHWRREG